MSKTFATLVDEIEQELQDTSNAIWTAAEIGIQLEDSLREISTYVPYVMRETFEVETRTGTATATTANALVDSTESQFLSTDTGKVIFNDDDNTFAIVTAYVSSSQLTLSKDIMASGEDYKMFNSGCHDPRQVNIENVTDYIGPKHGVLYAEYPTMGLQRALRNCVVERHILTLDLDFTPSDSADTDANKEVYVWFNKRQRVSQLTTLSGAIDLSAGYVAGSTTIHVDTLQTTGTFAEGTLFTIAGIRGTYRVTANAAIASSECDLTIWPGLESAAVNDDAVTIIGSTLSPDLEYIVVELCAGRCAISKTRDWVNKIKVGGMGPRVSESLEAWGQRKVANALTNLRALTVPITKRSYYRSN